jgi:hypothetical protein
MRAIFINEKFTENDDPIISMGIGSIKKFTDLIDTFHIVEINNYIFTIYVQNDFIDFWFNQPIISKLDEKEQNKLFDYIKNLIKKMKLSSILVNPKLIKHYDKQLYIRDNIKKFIPGIVRFQIIPSAKNILDPSSNRRSGNKFKFYEIAREQSLYLKNLKKRNK